MSPPGAKAEHDFQGVHVQYAVHYPEADELIEQFIRLESAPRQLTVVSDDHRLQQAARRRRCVVLCCLDYSEGLSRKQRRRLTQRETEKREGLSTDEIRHWLDEFAGLEKDLKPLEPFDYGEKGFEEIR